MLKKITFFTVHQAPHNTFIFEGLKDDYNLEIFYLNEKLSQYNWNKTDFYFPGSYSKSIFKYFKASYNSDLSIISGWHSKKYILLFIFLKLFKKKYAIYTDLDILSFKKYGFLKKLMLQKAPYIFVTGKYGETFLRRYLKKKNTFNFPYGVKSSDNKYILKHNNYRISEINKSNKIVVFISNRFIARKGYDMVIQLLKDLVTNNLSNKFHFRIAGNGDLYHNVKKEISSIDIQADFLSYINYENYIFEMLNCDIYLQCSNFEPYGIPPIDAFLSGKIVVATSKIYSIYDIYDLHGTVYEFKYKNQLQLFEYFKQFCFDKTLFYSNNKYLSITEPFLFKAIHKATLKSIL
jgi:hypothetical protein